MFECTLAGFSTEVIHKNEKQLKGVLREKIASELLDEQKSANIWRNEETKN